jgi:hypothetical protein
MFVGVISTVFGFGGVAGAPTSCPQITGAHAKAATAIQPDKRFDAIRMQNSPDVPENLWKLPCEKLNRRRNFVNSSRRK